MKRFPFRIGTTSYIIPDEILPNVTYLADQVDDVELVLFEAEDGQNNLPGPATLHGLARLASQYQLSYTVHLPLDLHLAADGSAGHISMLKAHKVIELTRDLDPWAYVLHLDGREVRTENLENYPLQFWDEVLRRRPASRCIDIGHLWLNEHDPLPYLQKHLSGARVLHIHGIADRDHKSLANVPRPELARVLNYIVQANFPGVLTIEVFGEEDFLSSMDAIQAALDAI